MSTCHDTKDRILLDKTHTIMFDKVIVELFPVNTRSNVMFFYIFENMPD